MIGLDSSVLISFLHGEQNPEVDRLVELLTTERAILCPSTVTEILSDPKGGGQLDPSFADIPVIPIQDGFWERAGLLRAAVRRAGRKAALGDALIAQSCLDADLALLTRDRDFEAFAQIGGLRLA